MAALPPGSAGTCDKLDVPEMSDDRLSAAIIGLGRIGADCHPTDRGTSRIRSHAHAFVDCERTRLVAGCDSDADTRDLYRRRWGIERVFDNHIEMLERTRPELVSICVPTAVRGSILKDSIDTPSVKGIVLEKPFAATLAEAERLVALTDAAAIKVTVNHIRRFPPAYRKIKEQIRNGTLGEIQHVNVRYTRGIINNGGHVFDLLRFFFGEPADLKVIGVSGVEIDDDPNLDVLIRYDQGFEIWMKALLGEAFNIFDVDIVGTEGRLLIDDLGHRLQYYPVEDMRPKNWFRQLGPGTEVQSTGLADAIGHAVTDLVDCIDTDGKTTCGPRDGHAALELSLRALAQATG
jgi:predicted dehydrogenase